MNENTKSTIFQAVQDYLYTLARSENTLKTYRNALNSFLLVLEDRKLPPSSSPVSQLSEDCVSWFAAWLKDYAPTTERLYMTAIVGFYEYLSSERLADINLPRVRLLIKKRTRRPGLRLPQFPADNILTVLNYAQSLADVPTDDEQIRLRNLRDRAFLLTLADTGLRVHEACQLMRGDLDWNDGKAQVIGKGDRQALVHFSSRAMSALRDYLGARATVDGSSGKPITSLPLFARHDRGAGKKIKRITTATGRNIVNQRVAEALGPAEVGTITPHSFRHYFVTVVLRASGNLKLAQELARHRNIAVTQRYAHLSNDELDKGYWDIFENKE